MQCVSKKSDGGWGVEFNLRRADAFFGFFHPQRAGETKAEKGFALRRLGGVGNEIVFFSLAIQITKIINLSDGGLLHLSYLFPSP